jgi:predicted dehydrogenase
MVFCEWPLGVNMAEATELKEKADDAGVRTVVGLQARYSPQVQFAKQLVADGYIGDVLSTSLVGSASSWGGVTTQNNSYIFDDSNGVSPLSVSMLHALDALNFILGEFDSVSAVSAVRRPVVRIADDDSIRRVTTPDQVAVCGRLKSGAIASIVYRGGQSRGSNLFWEINGSDGDLVFHSNIGNIQVADLRLQAGHGNDNQVTDLSVPDPEKKQVPALPGGMSSNVARLYMQFARDLNDGTQNVPDFAYAVTRHELIDHIKRAAIKVDSCRFDSFATPGSQGPRYES